MTWTITNLVIQIVTGILGALMLGAAEKSHSFGLVGNAVLGLIGGALSGCFLQEIVATVVNGAGAVTPPTAVENAVFQVLAGAVSGAGLLLVASIVKLIVHEHNASGTKAKY
jgi:hypothetical protein